MIRRQLKRAVQVAASNRFFWPMFKTTWLRVSNAMVAARQVWEEEQRRGQVDAVAREVSPNLQVLRGPFSGLSYPEAAAYGSALIPKLLGCYEAELHPVIEALCKQGFDHVYNIGCAEGYYAVGLARRMTQARVWAFDLDDAARRVCAEMAKANGVADRVEVRGEVQRKDLFDWPPGGLILSDCEGFEAQLFDGEVARYHQQSTVLIEVHDAVDPNLSVQMRKAFEKTHRITVITSIDDIKKIDAYDPPELRSFDRRKRGRLLSEHRPVLMDWFLCTPLNSNFAP